MVLITRPSLPVSDLSIIKTFRRSRVENKYGNKALKSELYAKIRKDRRSDFEPINRPIRVIRFLIEYTKIFTYQ